MGQLEEMSVFVEITRAGGITGAADALNLAPSAVSRRLKDLEARLGVQLLTRTTRKITLTDAGEKYLEHATRILHEVEEANSDLSEISGTLSGRIKLAAPLSFSLVHLPEALAAFQQKHPDIRVVLNASDGITDLTAEGFDLALRIANLPDSSLMAKRITTIRNNLAASPAFIKKHGPFKKLEDLHNLPACCYSMAARPNVFDYTDPKGSKGILPVTPVLTANNGDILRDMAARGMGLVCEPCFIMQQALDDGSLVPLFEDYNWGEISLQAVWPPTRHLAARTRALIDFFAERFKSL